MKIKEVGTFQERADYVARQSKAPKVLQAKVGQGVLRLELNTGAVVEFPARELRPLRDATDAQLADLRVAAGGAVLMWRGADVDLSVATILEIATGLQTSTQTGAIGGRARSEAKTAAVRANGAKGGRPRKQPALT